ncbi:MAG: HEAT repeat domain-containing protein [Planctomycetota bacterium]
MGQTKLRAGGRRQPVFLGLLLLIAGSGADVPPSAEDLAWQAVRHQMQLAVDHDPQAASPRPEALRGLATPAEREPVYRDAVTQLTGRDWHTGSGRVLRYGGEEAVPTLAAALPTVAVEPARGILHFLSVSPGETALPHLIRAAERHPLPDVRHTALQYVVWARHPSAREVLWRRLNDPAPHAVALAAEGLSYLDEPEAFAALADLNHADLYAAHQMHPIVRALWRIDAARAERFFVRAAANTADPLYGRWLREYAVEEPENLQRPEPLDAGQRRVSRLIRAAPTIAHEAWGQGEFAALMEQAGDHDSPLQAPAILALGQARHAPAVPSLIAQAQVRPASAVYTVLAQIATPEALTFLTSQARSGGEGVRLALSQGLGASGSRAAASLLFQLLGDPTLRTEPHDLWGLLSVPAGHRAYHVLSRVLGEAAEPKWHNVAHGPLVIVEGGVSRPFDIDREIAKCQRWWAEHGDNFLRGRPVPRLVLYHLFAAS